MHIYHSRSVSSWRTLLVSGLAAVLVLGLSACSSSETTTDTDAVIEPEESTISQVYVTMSNISGNDTCAIDVDTVPAGAVTFNVTNESSTAIKEVELQYNQRIIGEKENLVPGFQTVSFTLNLDGGSYVLYCPNADVGEHLDFTVTGTAVQRTGTTYEILEEGVELYADYITEQIALLEEYTGYFDDAIQAGDIEGAKQAYADARKYYERAESAVDSFLLPGTTDPDDNNTNIDYLIDMRASSYDEDAGWAGYHAIERHLWELGEINDETKELSTALLEHVIILNQEVIPTFADDLAPEDLANGAASLLEEISTTKITGEENVYSKLDLIDFVANVEGAHQAYAALRDGLILIDADIVEEIDQQFTELEELLKTYQNEDNLGGYEYYTDELKESDGPILQAALDPLVENIATLAELVVLA